MANLQDFSQSIDGFDPYDPYPPWNPDGRSPPLEQDRTVVSVIISVLCVHVVLVANYVHLQRAQKVKHASKASQVIRLAIFTLMPTLVLAEVIINVIRTIRQFIFTNPDKLNLKGTFADARRIICGLGGMRVAPKRPFRDDEDDELENREPLLATASAPAESSPQPPLTLVDDFESLTRENRKWTALAALTIVLLLLAIAQSVGTIVLVIRRHNGGQEWLSFDQRNLMAAISSITCSITGIVIIACRSEWSFKPLANWVPQHTPFIQRISIWELILASYLYEAPFTYSYEDEIPLSWIAGINNMFGYRSNALSMIFWVVILVWFVLWAFRERIRESNLARINWQLVFGVPLVALLIWIAIDDIAFFVIGVLQLCGINASYHDKSRMWTADPWAKYIPFC